MARPPKPINWAEVEKRMEIGQNGIEIASCLRLDVDTFYRRFKEEYGENFGGYAAKLPVCGPQNILFMQYIKAMKGNTKMLELLGREWLGQGKGEDINKKDLEAKFKEGMSQLISSLASDRKIEDSNINKETKS